MSNSVLSADISPSPCAVFVYGTLKQGEVRAPLWPREPLEILPAVTQGELYDLGPYPGMLRGDDSVRGELWVMREADIAATLERLDQIEGYNQGGENWYERRQVECVVVGNASDSQHRQQAWTYFFAGEINAEHHVRITANADGECCWPGR